MHRRYELTQAQWDFIKGELAPPKPRGRPRADLRKMLNGILWILHSGASWRDLPLHYGPWKTVYGYFERWAKSGLFDRILRKLQIRLDEEGLIDWDIFMVDGTSIRASKAAAGAGKRGEPESPPITLWGAREAGLVPRSILLAMEEDSPWPPRSRRARSTSARSSKSSPRGSGSTGPAGDPASDPEPGPGTKPTAPEESADGSGSITSEQ